MQTAICRCAVLALLLFTFAACSLVSEDGGGVSVAVTGVDPPEFILDNYGKRTIYYYAEDAVLARLLGRLPINYRDLPRVPPGGRIHIGPEDISGYTESTTEVGIWWTVRGKQWNVVRVFLPGE